MTENVYQDIQTKWHAIYPLVPNNWSELEYAYWNDATRGNNGGVPLRGDALLAHLASHGGGTGYTSGLTAFASYLDATGPVISAETVANPDITTATVTWTTNEAATSKVDYGLTSSYGSTTTLDATLVTSHSVGLSGLTGGTTYHYRVRSKDAQNNETVGTDHTFVTDPAETVIIHDTFTHANNFNPSGQVPDTVNTPGHSYVVSRGSWFINSNQLFTGVSGATISVACDSNNPIVDCDVITGSAIDTGLGFGFIIHMQTNADTTGTYVGFDQGIGIRVGNGGVNVSPVLSTTAWTPVANTTYHWRIVATAAGALDLYIDSVLIVQVTGCSTAFGTGISMFEFAPTNRIRFDNFKVSI